MDRPFNITKVVENQRLGFRVQKQLDLSYSKLKCLSEDVTAFQAPDSGTQQIAPVISSRFCPLKNYEHYMASANEDGRVIIHNTGASTKHTKQLLHFQAHDNAIFDIAWTNCDFKLITASGDHSAALWQLTESNIKNVLRLRGHDHSVKTISCKPDDPYILATGGRDGFLLVWDTRVGCHVTTIGPDKSIKFSHEAPGYFKTKRKESQANSVTGLVYQDGVTLISCSAGDGLIKVWDMRKTYSTRKPLLPVSKYDLPYCGTGRCGFSGLAISPCKLRLYANCIDNNIYCYNIGTYHQKPIAKYSGHLVSTFYVKNSVSPDGCYIASGSSDGRAYIWNVNNQLNPIVTLNGHIAEVTGIDWCVRGELMVATCSDDATYQIWRMYPQELARNDPTLRGWAESYTSGQWLNNSSLKRKYSSPYQYIASRPPLKEAHRLRCSESTKIEKKQDIKNSLDMSNLIHDLPNYVMDGKSPHVYRPTSSHKVTSDHWLTRIRKAKENHSPSSPTSTRKKLCTRRSKKVTLHSYFKVSSRPPVCDQSTSSSQEIKNNAVC